jgi:hypothetical protein
MRVFHLTLALFLVSFALTTASAAWMYANTGLTRISPMEGLSQAFAYHPRITVQADREMFLKEIPAGSTDREAEVLRILEWVMNQIPSVESNYERSSWKMIENGRAGRGLICAGMAQVFADALLSHGIPARRVFLQRSVFDNVASHVTVETWVNGKWRVYDPTFHVALRSGGQRVGITEARAWFLKGRGQPIKFEFLGDVKYPARLQTYPLPLEAMMTHAFVYMQRDAFPRNFLAYQDDDLGSAETNLRRAMYYTTVLILPSLTGVLLLIVLAMAWSRRRPIRNRAAMADGSG